MYRDLGKSNRTTGDRVIPLAAFSMALQVILAMGSAIASAQHVAGTVGLWHFDEGAGPVVRDASESAFDGKIVNGASFVDGRSGKALSFNGSGQYVSLPTRPLLDGAQGMTIEAWVNPGSGFQSSYRAVFYASDSGASNNYVLQLLPESGGVRFYVKPVLLDYAKAIPANAWTHIAATYDRATMILYVNGEKVASAANSSAIRDNGTPKNIGRYEGGGQDFRGLIDEVRVLNRALSPAEIAKNATAKGVPFINPPRAAPTETATSQKPPTGPPQVTARPARPIAGASYPFSKAIATADQNAVVRGDTAFALDLYARLSSRPGNLFFSPYSVSTALAMTYSGAAGGTAAEMAKTLHLGLPPERLHAAYGGIIRSLNQGGEKGGYALSVANALWGQKGADFLPPFLDLVRREYGAGLSQLDFKNDAEGARGRINDWVSDKTSGKIKDLIGPRVLTKLTRLVLTNAIYFKGKWASEFKKERTQDQFFYVEPGKEIKVPLMTQTRAFGYFETDSFQALEMAYRGDDVSLVAILPRDRYGLAGLEKTFSANSLRDWLARLQSRAVEVHFPRFKMTEQFELAKELKALGMREAFAEETADFSLMNGKRPPDPESLRISDVIHKAFVEVNEEGTEAAAATAVRMPAMTTSVQEYIPPPVFRADHAFLFLIRDRKYGSILFLGRVANPKQ